MASGCGQWLGAVTGYSVLEPVVVTAFCIVFFVFINQGKLLKLFNFIFIILEKLLVLLFCFNCFNYFYF